MHLVSMNQLSFKVSSIWTTNAYKLETFSKEMWEVLEHATVIVRATIPLFLPILPSARENLSKRSKK